MKRQDRAVLLIGIVAFAGTFGAWWIASARRASRDVAQQAVVATNPNEDRVVELVRRRGGDATWVFVRPVEVSDALGIPPDGRDRLHSELLRIAVARKVRYAFFADPKGSLMSGQPVLLTTNFDLGTPTSSPQEIDMRGAPTDLVGRRLAGWPLREPVHYGLGWARN